MLSTDEGVKWQFEFMRKTDRKSLYHQLKYFVDIGKDDFQDQVNERRDRLAKLLALEDKVFEQEFAASVKIRMDLDIQKRNEVRYQKKEAMKQTEHEFLKHKRIQTNINNCYEVREAFRRREREYTRLVLEEQMVEKERMIKKEQEMEKFWLEVAKVNAKQAEHSKLQESCIKKKFMEKLKFVLDRQLEEHAEKRELQKKEKQAEIESIARLLQELQLERMNNLSNPIKPKQLQYRKELLQTITENRCRKEQEKLESAQMHRRLMAEIRQLELHENEATRRRKQACLKSTLEYIEYVRRMRQHEGEQQRWRNSRIDEVGRIDKCTKTNIKQVRDRKAAEAVRHYADLRKQICDDLERKLREEAEYRNRAMLINPFGRPDPTRDQIREQQRRHCEELDKQLVELQRIRAEEAQLYEKGLMLAANDPQICAALAEKYIRKGIDYLAPHDNWQILGCPPPPRITTPEYARPPALAQCPHEVCGCAALLKPETSSHHLGAHGAGQKG